MKQNDPVNIIIGMIGTHLKVNLPYQDYEDLFNKISTNKDHWLTIPCDEGVEIKVKRDSIQYLKLIPRGVRVTRKKTGVTLRQVAQATGEKYDTLRQRLKREGIELEKASDRRIILSQTNFQLLNLTTEHQLKLKKLEATRSK